MKLIYPLLVLLCFSQAKAQVSDTIEVSYLYNVTILFEDDIIDEPRFGSSVALVFDQPDQNTINIKADGQYMLEHNQPSIPNTNMTVRTTTKLYNFILTYNKTPSRTIVTPGQYRPVYVYNINTKISDEIPPDDEILNDSLLLKLSNQPQDIYDIGHNASSIKMTLTVTNIWVDSDHIYIKYILENYSAVPYDIEYFRYVSTYKKWSFNRTTDPITEYQPVAKLGGSKSSVLQGEPYVDVVAFQKFTLNKKEYLNIQIGENNGARLISTPISWSDLLSADSLPPHIKD